jgi:hypothetical protein
MRDRPSRRRSGATLPRLTHAWLRAARGRKEGRGRKGRKDTRRVGGPQGGRKAARPQGHAPRGTMRTAQQRRFMQFADGSRRASDSQGRFTRGVASRPLETRLWKS